MAQAIKQSAYYLNEKIENANLQIIEDTGHVVNEENPKMLAHVLDEYYAKF